MRPEIYHYSDIKEMGQAAAELMSQLAAECINKRGIFTVALSGGSTPRTLYELLAQAPYLNTMPWAHVYLFWGDERYVPADHPDSNFAMASRSLIKHVPIPKQNVHRILTEHFLPEEAAEVYENTLRDLFQSFASLSEDGLPVFDLILLGLGKDGHTASLFPDSPVLEEQERWVVATPIPNLTPQVRRITMHLLPIFSKRIPL
jgi:6-phosphogluconolactonase